MQEKKTQDKNYQVWHQENHPVEVYFVEVMVEDSRVVKKIVIY